MRLQLWRFTPFPRSLSKTQNFCWNYWVTWISAEMLKPPRFFLVYLEVCLQSVNSHGAFWKMKCLQAWAFCFPKCHSSFFPRDTCQYHGKKMGSIFKLSNVLGARGVLEGSTLQLHLRWVLTSGTLCPKGITLHWTHSRPPYCKEKLWILFVVQSVQIYYSVTVTENFKSIYVYSI